MNLDASQLAPLRKQTRDGARVAKAVALGHTESGRLAGYLRRLRSGATLTARRGTGQTGRRTRGGPHARIAVHCTPFVCAHPMYDKTLPSPAAVALRTCLDRHRASVRFQAMVDAPPATAELRGLAARVRHQAIVALAAASSTTFSLGLTTHLGADR